MSRIILSLVAMSSLGFSGGDIAPEQVPATVFTDTDETGFYLGAGITAVSSRDAAVSMNIFEVTDGQDRLGNATLLAGYMINDYLAVEGRYGFTFTDKDVGSIDSRWSLLLKPMYRFQDDDDIANSENYFSVYALLGYGGAKLTGIDTTNVHTTVNVDDNGFQWGLGLSYTFRETSNNENYQYKDTWTVYADYTQVGNDMDGSYYNGIKKVDVDAFTVGVIYKF